MLYKKIVDRDERGCIKSYVSLVNGEEVKEDHIYCKSCDTIKHQSLFSKDPKGRYGKSSTCKECASKRSREHHAARMLDPDHRKKRRLYYNTLNKDRKLYAISLLGGKCFDCGGVFHPSVYDFHHVDPSTKEGNPSSFLTKSDERLKEELSKCVLLCANCHRIRHFGEGT